MAEPMKMVNLKKKLLKLVFECSFLFWLILAGLELLLPGMVIHYVNLNLWLLVVCIFAILNVVVKK